MSDEKMQRVAELTGKYTTIIATNYKTVMQSALEDDVGIATEDARTMAISAFIAAHGVVHPRQSYRGRGHGNAPKEKTYIGGNWDDKITEGQLKRLKWMVGKLETHFFENLKDTVGAKETAAETLKIIWAEKFDSDMPESSKDWTKGNASWVMDALQQRFPELFPKKEGQS